MSCSCHSDAQKRLTDHIATQLPEGSVNLDLSLNGYVFGFDGTGMTHRAALPVEYEFQAPKKSGGMKTVKKKTFLRATFCPICGEKYDKTEQQ